MIDAKGGGILLRKCIRIHTIRDTVQFDTVSRKRVPKPVSHTILTGVLEFASVILADRIDRTSEQATD